MDYVDADVSYGINMGYDSEASLEPECDNGDGAGNSDSDEEDTADLRRDMDMLMEIIDRRSGGSTNGRGLGVQGSGSYIVQPTGEGQAAGKGDNAEDEEGGGGEISSSDARRDFEKDWQSDDEDLAPIPSNDDLFYDPDVDDANQRWIDGIRRSGGGLCGLDGGGRSVGGAQGKQQRQWRGRSYDESNGSGGSAIRKSDAILACPCCFAVVCIDCQKHDRFHNQYRAAFFHRESCRVSASPDTAVVASGTDGEGENVYAVSCSQCSEQLGVRDENYVFHFFNVIPSEA